LCSRVHCGVCSCKRSNSVQCLTMTHHTWSNTAVVRTPATSGCDYHNGTTCAQLTCIITHDMCPAVKQLCMCTCSTHGRKYAFKTKECKLRQFTQRIFHAIIVRHCVHAPSCAFTSTPLMLSSSLATGSPSSASWCFCSLCVRAVNIRDRIS
jgi:hypothetical protein